MESLEESLKVLKLPVLAERLDGWLFPPHTAPGSPAPVTRPLRLLPRKLRSFLPG